MNRTIEVEITGTSPLLMHRFPLVSEENLKNQTPSVQAEASAYRDEGGELYLPGVNLWRSLISAAAFSKGKGRASLQKPAAACLLVTPERLMLGTKKYAIDSRAVVVPATRGRVVRHRPRLNEWSVVFTLEFDDALISANEVRRVVDDAGLRVGVGDFRPEKKGPYGRFSVTSWRGMN